MASNRCRRLPQAGGRLVCLHYPCPERRPCRPTAKLPSSPVPCEKCGAEVASYCFGRKVIGRRHFAVVECARLGPVIAIHGKVHLESERCESPRAPKTQPGTSKPRHSEHFLFFRPQLTSDFCAMFITTRAHLHQLVARRRPAAAGLQRRRRPAAGLPRRRRPLNPPCPRSPLAKVGLHRSRAKPVGRTKHIGPPALVDVL